MTALVVLSALLVGAVAMVTVSCLRTASRLRRLQRRCRVADASLRTHLANRSAIALRLASVADTAAARDLLAAAGRARAASADAGSRGEWSAESDLTRALRQVSSLGSPEQALVSMVEDSQRLASMARRIHNDGVALAGPLRQRRRSRWLRLEGHQHSARMIEFDDGMR